VRRLTPAGVRDLLLIALTFSSGAVDAISFLALGKVFTAFMTGNLVFVGFGAAGLEGPNVAHAVLAIGVFGAGVALATRITGESGGPRPWPRRVTVVLGAVALAQLAFAIFWAAANARPGSGAATLLIAISALAMGLQSGAILTLGVRGVFTTATTATLMFLSRDLASRASSAAEIRRLGGVLVGLPAGAAAGGLLLLHARAYAPLLPPVMTGAVVAVAAAARSRRALNAERSKETTYAVLNASEGT
jgi:uncharacterized membrane protein YoaK (UPF0700 family)